MRFAGPRHFGRLATRLAIWRIPPHERNRLARLNPRGYIAPNAIIHHADLHLGEHVAIDERVFILQGEGGGPVELGAGVHLQQDVRIGTAVGGSLKIGANSFVNHFCFFLVFEAPIHIGCDVLIGPHCAFYPAYHPVTPGKLIREQPLQTKGGIIIEDDVWLGHGVTVLDGVRIGKGAVVGAGAVVTRDIPAGAITAGVPARVVKMRSDLAETSPRSASLTEVE